MEDKTATGKSTTELMDAQREILRETGFSEGSIFDLEAGLQEAHAWRETWRTERPKVLQQQAKTHRLLLRSVDGWSPEERQAVDFQMTIQSWLTECRTKPSGEPDKEAFLSLLREALPDEAAVGTCERLWPSLVTAWHQLKAAGSREEHFQAASFWSLLSWLRTHRVNLREELERASPAKSSASPSTAARKRKGARAASRWLTLLVLDLADAEEPHLHTLTIAEAYCTQAGGNLTDADAQALKLARQRAHSRTAKGLAIIRAAFGEPFGGERGAEYQAGVEVQRALKTRLGWATALAKGRSLGGVDAWDHATGSGAGLAFLRRLRPRPGMPHRWPPNAPAFL